MPPMFVRSKLIQVARLILAAFLLMQASFAMSCVITASAVPAVVESPCPDESPASAPAGCAAHCFVSVSRAHKSASPGKRNASPLAIVVAAAQLPDPVLKLGVDNLPVNGADRFSLTRDFMTMRRIGLMQELTREKKRELRGQKFEREADKSTAEKDAAIAAIQRDSAIAWLERYCAEAMDEVRDDNASPARTDIISAQGADIGTSRSQADAIATHSTLAALEERAS